jgi:site-specific DNA recombinase
VHEEQMGVVRRIFREVGAEGRTLYSVKADLNREGVPSPSGDRYWSLKYIRDRVNDDLYKPHAYSEVSALVSPEVALRLDPHKSYGVWWFNRRRHEVRHVVEGGPGGERRYRRQSRVTEKPRREWIAIPVPDAGVPRAWVHAAREAIEDNARPSANANRVWELSGGILHCGECGCRMNVHTTDKRRGYAHHYYRCAKRNRHGAQHSCAHGKHHRTEALESAVWGLVRALLEDPARIKAGLEELIEQERAGTHGDPDREEAAWFEKLSEAEHERWGYLRLAAKGHMTDDDLAEALAELEDTRATAEREARHPEPRLQHGEPARRSLSKGRERLRRRASGVGPREGLVVRQYRRSDEKDGNGRERTVTGGSLLPRRGLRRIRVRLGPGAREPRDGHHAGCFQGSGPPDPEQRAYHPRCCGIEPRRRRKG